MPLLPMLHDLLKYIFKQIIVRQNLIATNLAAIGHVFANMIFQREQLLSGGQDVDLRRRQLQYEPILLHFSELCASQFHLINASFLFVVGFVLNFFSLKEMTKPYIAIGFLSFILPNRCLCTEGHKLGWLRLPRVSLMDCVAPAR